LNAQQNIGKHMKLDSDPHPAPADAIDSAVSSGSVHQRTVFASVAASVDAEAEIAYWREHCHQRPYVNGQAGFNEFADAYRDGAATSLQHGNSSFAQVEADLARDWSLVQGSSQLDWKSAREASLDAWQHVRSVPHH